jgi:hypothetical protein
MTSVKPGEQSDVVVPYESPVLIPIGSLHDLLAGTGTQSCDAGVPDPGPTPINPDLSCP